MRSAARTHSEMAGAFHAGVFGRGLATPAQLEAVLPHHGDGDTFTVGIWLGAVFGGAHYRQLSDDGVAKTAAAILLEQPVGRDLHGRVSGGALPNADPRVSCHRLMGDKKRRGNNRAQKQPSHLKDLPLPQSIPAGNCLIGLLRMARS